MKGAKRSGSGRQATSKAQALPGTATGRWMRSQKDLCHLHSFAAAARNHIAFLQMDHLMADGTVNVAFFFGTDNGD